MLTIFSPLEYLLRPWLEKEKEKEMDEGVCMWMTLNKYLWFTVMEKLRLNDILQLRIVSSKMNTIVKSHSIYWFKLVSKYLVSSLDLDIKRGLGLMVHNYHFKFVFHERICSDTYSRKFNSNQHTFHVGHMKCYRDNQSIQVDENNKEFLYIYKQELKKLGDKILTSVFSPSGTHHPLKENFYDIFKRWIWIQYKQISLDCNDQKHWILNNDSKSIFNLYEPESPYFDRLIGYRIIELHTQ